MLKATSDPSWSWLMLNQTLDVLGGEGGWGGTCRPLVTAQGTGDAKVPQTSPSPSRVDPERSGEPDWGERTNSIRRSPGLESGRCQETGREIQARGWDGETLESFVE